MELYNQLLRISEIQMTVVKKERKTRAVWADLGDGKKRTRRLIAH